VVWILLIILLSLAVAGGSWFWLKRKAKTVNTEVDGYLEAMQTQLTNRQDALRKLAELILGFCPEEEIEIIKQEVATMESAFNAEHGRLTITHAELDAVRHRLNDLVETDKEIKSSLEAADKEYAILKSQEEEIKLQNSKLEEGLSSIISKIDELTSELKGSEELAKGFLKAKEDLQAVEGQFKWYESEIVQLNEKYIDLKKAYDALDIEYAQLYERQNR